MHGDERIQDGMFSYVSLEQRVPQDHPLRAVRKLTDTVLRSLSGRWPGHEVPQTLRAPSIHSFIVDGWEATNRRLSLRGGLITSMVTVGVLSPAIRKVRCLRHRL
jgi:hypothetical protein